MNRVQILTSWVSANDTHEMYPCTVAAYMATGCSYSDATGQPDANLLPTPNALVVEAIVTDSVLAMLEADATVIILSEELV